MSIRNVKSSVSPSLYGLSSVSAGTGGHTGGSFKDQLGSNLKEDYKKRFIDLLDEMAHLTVDLLAQVNIQAFERYLNQIKSLLSEIMRSAYVLDAEHIQDRSGRQRVFASIGIVDQKLDELAKNVLQDHSGNLDYLSRVDEIRGLVLDLLS